jgi:hypothetical protein
MVDWPPPKSKTHHIASSSLASPIFLGLTFDGSRPSLRQVRHAFHAQHHLQRHGHVNRINATERGGIRRILKDGIRYLKRQMIFLSSRAADVACMTKKGNSTPDDVVKAFRKAASELGCYQSERRFQEALFEIGRHKPEKRPSNNSPPNRRPGSSSK